MTTTHALVPLAAAASFGPRPIPWRIVIAAALAAALPDIDGLWNHLLHPNPWSIYGHRGPTHSLFAALAIGLIAACFARYLKVRALTAGVVIGASMASHGLLDMLTDQGLPVEYLWPVSRVRLFADWRPIHSPPVHSAHFIHQGLQRIESEAWQLLLPMAAIVFVFVAVRAWLRRDRKPPRREPRQEFYRGPQN